MKHINLSACTAALLTLTSPALAQNICGDNDSQWIGNDEAGSDITTATTYQEQMALVLGGNSYISRFTLSGPTDVRIEAQGRGTGDPLIELINTTGDIILADDDSGGAGAARAETQLEAGTYCVAVKSYDGAPLTAFVRIGRVEQDALTAGADAIVEETSPVVQPAGSCADARPLGGALSEGLTGAAPLSDTAFWRFSLAQDTPVSITAVADDADPTLALLELDGTYLNDNDDFDGLNSRLQYLDGLAPGDYCLEIGDLDESGLPITVSVTEIDPVAATQALYASGDVAPPLDGSVPLIALGELQNRLRHDALITGDMTWFTVEMPESGLLLAEAVSIDETGDTFMVVYDDLGRKVAENDDYGEGLDSLIAARVQAGTYLIGVRHLENNTAGNVRMALERYTASR